MEIKNKVHEILSSEEKFNEVKNLKKLDFNQIFSLLNEKLSKTFKNVELFNELASYYSGTTLLEMFKILNKDYREIIIKELQEHMGNKS